MSSLLHLDSSVRRASVSRLLSGKFAATWREAHPDGTYVYRDLAAYPVPHLDEGQVAVMNRLEAASVSDLDTARDAARTPEERASWAITWVLVEELLAADTIVVGLPMYNYSVPSTFKAWFDRVIIPPLIVNAQTGEAVLAGKTVVVASARGGAYGPGTPRAEFDHQESYLRAALSMLALDRDLTFVHSELTKSAHVPRLAKFKDAAAESHRAAVEDIVRAARTGSGGGVHGSPFRQTRRGADGRTAAA
jgi:FMN-dependent NADH-azoreductase